VGQALEIGPDQGLFGRWEGAVLAAVDLRGQQDDELAVCPAAHDTIRWPDLATAVEREELQPGVAGREQPTRYLPRCQRAGPGRRIRADGVKRHADCFRTPKQD